MSTITNPTRKRLGLFLLAAALFLVPLATGATPSEAATNLRSVDRTPGSPVDLDTGRVIVRFASGTSAGDQAAIHASLNARVVDELPALGLVIVEAPNPAATQAIAASYAANPRITLARPDALLPLADAGLIPNDTYYSYQWQHDAIDSPEAWAIQPGVAQTLITICDTGVDAGHPDIVGNLRADLGTNTAGKNNDWSPVHYHGTAVAGAAAAAGNNGIGVSGVSWSAGIVPVRVSDRADGAASLSALAACIQYGADQGSAAINVSYTTYTNGEIDPVILAAAGYAEARGSVTVIAAGNSDRDDAPTQDPKTILYVAATTAGNGKASFSNFGHSVDIAAPGESVVTTYSEVSCRGRNCSVGLRDYAFVSGTSFAAPIVAGAVALTADAHAASVAALPVADRAAYLRGLITGAACDLGAAGEDIIFGAGLLNVHDAVHGTACSNPIAPPSINSVLVTPILATMFVDATQQFDATAVWSDGSASDVTNQVVWSSSDSATVTIDLAGLATGQAAGLTNINASLTTADGTVLGATPVLVSDAPPVGTASSVVSIEYTLSGGPSHDRNLAIAVTVSDDLGQPIDGASVEIWLANADTGQLWSGTSSTGADGVAPFSLKNAPSGSYSSTVIGVTAAGYTWDGLTPANGIVK